MIVKENDCLYRIQKTVTGKETLPENSFRGFLKRGAAIQHPRGKEQLILPFLLLLKKRI